MSCVVVLSIHIPDALREEVLARLAELERHRALLGDRFPATVVTVDEWMDVGEGSTDAAE